MYPKVFTWIVIYQKGGNRMYNLYRLVEGVMFYRMTLKVQKKEPINAAKRG